ncbi:putative NADPH dehydrogenase C23G7.10c [Mycena venus]|uniref:Putative NADPH dehydrogenase C23G7.10c n=1 Tax=Mycena venus TaxID=2733690 RepID=A0A8H6XEU7_9AGAR|nr:putative NADPH dehydrogenase C23G7.10c [Mycena venus]
MAHINTPVPGAREFYPLNEPAIGTHQGGEHPDLFKPLEIKGLTFKNRIFVGFATRGVGAICMEATSVVPEGRISPEDAGLWKDSQIAPLKRIVEFSHAQGTKIGIQLAHAGRKASTYAPWRTKAAGPIMFTPRPPHLTQRSAPPQKEMTEQDMKYIEDAFVAATKRCKEIGFDFIEVHGAHGYLIHEFVSPISNTRTDQYGGPLLENRLERIREEWKDKPLFVRISATDWAEGPEKSEDGAWLQWGIEQSTLWVGKMLSLGVIDLLDVSSGGNWFKEKVGAVGRGNVGHGYLVPFSEAIKKAHPSLIVGAVGMISDPVITESYLKDGKADVVFLARELMRNPHWALAAAKTLGAKVKAANQYHRAW